MAKRQIEIERLLQWAYRDELPKRQTSSAEGIWDRLAQNGSLGGIDPDPGHGAAQRYAHFGLPHPDAEEVERAVSALPDGSLDWAVESDPILGHLLALADTRPRSRARSETTIGYNNRHQDKIGWRTEKVPPAARDVLMVRSLRTSVLVSVHANKGTRPEWHEVHPRAFPIRPAHGGGETVIVGECKGKNRYTTGSYCPLRWEPSPIEIASARGDYLAWWRGMALLARELDLDAHEVLPPEAPEYPWEDARRGVTTVFENPRPPRQSPLPLKPKREPALPPLRADKGPVTKKLTLET